MNATGQGSVTRDQYEAAREANIEVRLRVMRLLDAAGVSGYATVEELLTAQFAATAAFAGMSHEDRMGALDAESNARRDLLDSLRRNEHGVAP